MANGPLLRIFSRCEGTPDQTEGSLMCEIYDNPQPFTDSRLVTSGKAVPNVRNDQLSGRVDNGIPYIRWRRKAGCRGEIE